ncbi:transglycosylase SLT domain-containing protein [Actinomycetospora straminea]|uniref:Transglycosylase SLT domain-containing protein n=1 Tax=Actinomycetospora straminea TaxID=663607 RepID=A0ABP9FAY1_9PSEU|nr:transglycosylase SLT domain-containing protein [Actinomycetospora straminea]MDD7936617.1 transglycosylase SLT domain-containing protein [Actinomycetospora straminea]
MPRADLEGQLAGEPAAAELAAIVAQLRTVDPGAIRGVAAQVLAVGEGVDGSVRAVDRGAAAVEGRWEGEGAAAFGGWVASFRTAAASERRAITEAGTTLGHVGTVLDVLRREVEQQVTQALAMAGAARDRTIAGGSIPPALADGLAAHAVRGPTDTARAAVARAEGELTDAAARLRGAAEAMTAFAALPAPDVAVMAPPRGTPVPWRPIEDVAATSTGSLTGAGSAADPGSNGSAGGASSGAAGGGAGGGSSASGTATGGTGPAPAGQVGDWIRQAMAILQESGVPPEKMDPADIATIIDRESGGDPNAVNDWDSNADRGTPSQGLMQTIGPTFEAHKLPGHDDIRDPVDNIIAGVRYAVARYGSVSRVPGVEALARGDAYVGY